MGHLKGCPYCKGRHRLLSQYKKCKRRSQPERWPK